MRIVVLGASGMLGTMLADVFEREPDVELVCSAVETDALARGRQVLPRATWVHFDADKDPLAELAQLLNGATMSVNAIGIIKPYIRDERTMEVQRAIRINALFPHLLAEAAGRAGCRVLQIATDCVYSGTKGRYVESDPHDAEDVYGKTKSLGEVVAPGFAHLRCSIIGPEQKEHRSLLDWFLGQPPGSTVQGYASHFWNGVTTYHFARLCLGMAREGWVPDGVQHIVPAAALSKHELLACVARVYERDVRIECSEPRPAVDRTLATLRPDVNERCWALAGFQSPPSIPQMVEELRGYEYRFGDR
jgi:dTDP-4-dehydrorhamnose reductase